MTDEKEKSNILSFEGKRQEMKRSKKPVTREEFDALLEELDGCKDEIQKTQRLLVKVLRILKTLKPKPEKASS